jgi:hypothetical protein
MERILKRAERTNIKRTERINIKRTERTNIKRTGERTNMKRRNIAMLNNKKKQKTMEGFPLKED